MKKMTSEQIIRTYLDFFKERGHLEIPSSSLIPKDDPTILWINAGVTPLKKYFDGSVIPTNRRLTSCQKCIRTGDIESVGKTARHHTFFQMLGNFSVGDYFKKEALTWAYELLTSEKYFGLDKNKLYITVYPADEEAYNLWVSLGIDPSHIIKLENNFWEIGPGPSGPDSEIFYDRGEKYDPQKQGIKLLEQEIENDRYIEIWNNVFSQYNAKEGVPRSAYEELPSKNIDTGMGVERMACIMQETETNYETDLFMPIMDAISQIAKIEYLGQMEFKVIADHIRSLTFALSDGATFSNYGRGYVLRRLLRRAVRMSRKLNINHSFMAELVDVVVDKYNSIYPELNQTKGLVKELITKEEELFHRTLLSGEKKLEEIFTTSPVKQINGSDAFKLYDTYGFPIELTVEYANEQGFTVDTDGFQKYMNAQKELARSSRKVEASMNLQNEALMNFTEESTFIGYDTLGSETTVIAIMKDNNFVDSLNDEGYLILKENPFYAESGGQIDDTGYLKNDHFKAEVMEVVKAPNKQHLLYVKVLEGQVNKNDTVLTHVSQEKRESITRNHSATHLLQKTLQEFLGTNVHQAGSKVEEETFRFDFTYPGRLSDEIIVKIENSINDKVNAAYETKIEYMKKEEAIAKGAMALFDNKYTDNVRVVTMGPSIELCGGTHVKNTKDIGHVAIISVENKGADTFRIVGATDNNIAKALYEAIKPYNDEMKKLLSKAKKIIEEAHTLGIDLTLDFNINNDLPTGYKDIIYNKQELATLKESIKELEKTYLSQKTAKSISDLSAFIDSKEEINNINVIIAITKDYEISVLKQVVDALSNQVPNSFILLANLKENNANFIAKSNTSNEKLNCGSIIKDLSIKCGGNGGGNQHFAQGGGTNASELGTLLGEVKETIKNL